MQPWENGKNPTLISNPIWHPQIFFKGFYLDNVPNYHPMQFPWKLEKVTKKLILDHLAQIWAPNFFCEFFLY